MGFLKALGVDERGLETVEYAIIVGLIVAALVTVLASIGDWVKAQYDDLASDTGA